MASPYLIGRAAFFGADHQVAFAGVTATYTKGTSWRVNDTFDKKEAKDGVGNVFARAAVNRRYESTFDIYIVDNPAPGTVANAITKINLLLNASTPFGYVVISGTGTAVDGTWNYEGGMTYEAPNGDYLKISIPCSRYGDVPAYLAAV
jgi:hypothetical protein